MNIPGLLIYEKVIAFYGYHAPHRAYMERTICFRRRVQGDSRDAIVYDFNFARIEVIFVHQDGLHYP